MLESNVLKIIFNQTVINHYFELEVAKALDSKLVRPPIYLSIGTEHIPPSILAAFNSANFSFKDYAIFPQHRCHSYYLTFGGDPTSLALELCGSIKGCNKGMGGSASVSNTKTANLFGHSGLLGDQVPISVGYAHASHMHTVVIMGDATAEEDYVLGALGFAITKNVPILFLCEDNNLSILTEKKIRRSWNIVDVALGFGIDSIEIQDQPTEIYKQVLEFVQNPKPTLINILCQRHRWHAGSGIDNEPKWNTYEELVKTVQNEFGHKFVNEMLLNINSTITTLWKSIAHECS